MLMTTAADGSGAGHSTGGARQTAPYGSWKSPISADSLVQGSVRFGDTVLDGDTIYWIESRPAEAGRNVVVQRAADGPVIDLLPEPYNARTKAREYGGGALTVVGGIVYFVNYSDQCVYRIEPGQTPQAITRPSQRVFADFSYDARHDRLISVCENHSSEDQEPEIVLVALELDGSGQVTTLVSGCDFYSSPRVSPDGDRLAWLSWSHPNMPWDGTELSVARFGKDGLPEATKVIAGGQAESLFQPEWSPDGSLYFASDRTNWWNLFRYQQDDQTVQVTDLPAEFGLPEWVAGMSTYAVPTAGQLIASYSQNGQQTLVRIDTLSGQHSAWEVAYTSYEGVRANARKAYALAGSPSAATALVEFDLASDQTQIIRRSSANLPGEGYTSIPTAIEFPTTEGQTAHAFYYSPLNKDFQGPPDAAPPLIIFVHGGPTSATSAVWNAKVQYWTSRGFAVCDVNYRGSTGYGREYRNRLRESWGVADVEDAAHAAKFLAEQGKADKDKLLIRGGSAGGYTTLAALAFHNVFAAGASYYGVSDLSLLVQDTHKFEARYLDRLIGPYPEAKQTYEARSPIHHLDGFTQPVILFQGLEDKVVPPNQAETILAALRAKGIPVAYIPFEGEQHGFRKAENIVRCQQAELYFYGKILGFEPADEIEPVLIHGF